MSGNHEIALDDTYIHPKKRQLYLKEFPCKVISVIILVFERGNFG